MIKTYLIPTSGIDGLIYLPYHWGSNYLYALLSSLLNISTFKFYNLIYPIVFIPFLFHAIFIFISEFRIIKQVSGKLNLLSFLILFVAVIGIYPEIETNKSPLMTTIIVLSESYLMGLSFTLLFFAILLRYFTDFISNQKINKPFVLIIIPLFIGLISIFKISSGYLTLSLLAYLFLRKQGYKKVEYIFSFVASSIILIILLKLTDTYDSSNEGRFELFSFYKRHVDNFVYFSFFYYFFSIIAIILVFYTKSISNLKQTVNSIKEFNLWEVELLLVIISAGLLPGLVMDTIGRNALYFMDLQRWLSIAIIIGLFPKLVNINFKKIATPQKIIFIIPFVLFISMSFIFVPYNYYKQTKQAYIHNIYTRNSLIITADSTQKNLITTANLLTNLKSNLTCSQNAEYKLIEYKLIYQLIKLDSLPLSEKKKSCIYIPKTNKLYWNLLKYKTNGIPFIAPCLSGICMIEGIPDILSSGFGYNYIKNKKNANKVFSDSEILRIAKKKGFKQVFVIDTLNNEIVVRKLN